MVIALSLSAYFGNDYIALTFLSLATTIYLSYRGIWLMRLMGVDVWNVGRSLIFSFVVTALAVLCSLFLRVQLEYSELWLIASSTGLTLIYMLLVVARDEQILKMFGSLLKKS